MTKWGLAILAGVASAATVTGLALALDDDAGGRSVAQDQVKAGVMTAQQVTGDGDADGAADGDDGSHGQLRELMEDPGFRAQYWELRDEQQSALRAWWEQHADDPASDEARDALDRLRDAQHAALQVLMEKYGVEWQDAGHEGSALRELMETEEFRDELWALQDETGEAVESWWDEYGDDADSAAARTALQALREEQRAELEALYEKYGVEFDGRLRMGLRGGIGAGLLGGDALGGGLSGPGDGHGRDEWGGAGSSGERMSPDGVSGSDASSAGTMTF